MQVLKLLRHDLPRAIATDWRQTLCALHGHGGLTATGTSYAGARPVPGKPGVWDIGNACVKHYRCKKCDKAIEIKC